MTYDVNRIRADFPILSRQVNGRPLVYLDNGASAQKPQVVIDAMTKAYSEEYANVHRGLHYLSTVATEKYEAVRGIVARFLGVTDEREIVFTTGTTEAINLVSYAWAAPRLSASDSAQLRSAYQQADAERLQLKKQLADTTGQLRTAIDEKAAMAKERDASRAATDKLRSDLSSAVAALPPDPRGGSVEVTLGTASAVQLAKSFKLGVIRLTEKFVHTDPIAGITPSR